MLGLPCPFLDISRLTPLNLASDLGAVAQLGERVVRNDEVRGSIPLGSTSLRPVGYGSASLSPMDEGCLAIGAQQRRRPLAGQ